MIHPVIPFRQWRNYDCCAAVLRMGIQYFTGTRLSHRKSVITTGCKPDGVPFSRLKKTFRQLRVGAVQTPIRLNAIKSALDHDRLVVISDEDSYRESHAILIVGYTSKRFWVIDPMIGAPSLRSFKRVIQGADEAFIIYSKHPRRCRRV
jgi:hypothetical protein